MTLLDTLNESRKAIVAAAIPGLTIALNDVTPVVSEQAAIIAAVVLGGAATWLTPNKQPPAPPQVTVTFHGQLDTSTVADELAKRINWRP